MKKLNCWEAKECGREPGGSNSKELGTCPVSIETKADKINSGLNGGRSCWAIAGSLCGGKVQGQFATQMGGCLACDFFKQVAAEEEFEYKGSKYVKEKLS